MKKAKIIFVGILCMLLLAGCGNTKLAEGYDEQTIIDTAHSIIEEVHVAAFDDVLNKYMREDYLENYPMDNMVQQVLELRTGIGNFISFTKDSVIGQESPEGDEEFAVILVTATYDKGEINYTLTFDKDMKLVSFYAQ